MLFIWMFSFPEAAFAIEPSALNTPRGLDTARQIVIEEPHRHPEQGLVPLPMHTDHAAPLPAPLDETFTLHSNPGARHVIYLDFNGHTIQWEGAPFEYVPWNIEGSEDTFSELERTIIQRTWQSVAEDFLPFDLDITTEDPGIEALRNSGGADQNWGIRAVINHETDDYSWAYEDSFTDSEDTEMYIWTGEEDTTDGTWLWTADSITHEAGHALGLSHDGTTQGVEYYAGHGSGLTAWAPIMGWTHEGLSHWSMGDYTDANNPEDDLAIITTQNGFAFRRDDHGDTPDTASQLSFEATAPSSGIIETPLDIDAFQFTLRQTSTVRLHITPNPIAPNLDIEATLMDHSGTELWMANPQNTLDATIEYILEPGDYTLIIDGVGYDDPNSDGYSDYGSLGRYHIDAQLETNGIEEETTAGCACSTTAPPWSFSGIAIVGCALLRRRQNRPA